MCVDAARQRFQQDDRLAGILMHGIDLAHIVFGIFVPAAGVVLMAIAGPAYPIWYFLAG